WSYIPALYSPSASEARSANARWRGVHRTSTFSAPSSAASAFKAPHASTPNTTRTGCTVYMKGCIASVDLRAGFLDQFSPLADFVGFELGEVFGGFAARLDTLGF